MVTQSVRYATVIAGQSQTVTCTLKNTAFPWMSWYMQDPHGQLHFLESTRSIGDKETKTRGVSSYVLERTTETALRLTVSNVVESQTFYCTCSLDHSDKQSKGRTTNSLPPCFSAALLSLTCTRI